MSGSIWQYGEEGNCDRMLMRGQIMSWERNERNESDTLFQCCLKILVYVGIIAFASMYEINTLRGTQSK